MNNSLNKVIKNYPEKCLNLCVKAFNKKINIPEELISSIFDRNKEKKRQNNILGLILSLFENNNYENFLIKKLEYLSKNDFEYFKEINELLLTLKFKDINISIINLIINNLNEI